LATLSIASLPKPSRVIVVRQIRLRSCGVARSSFSSVTIFRMNTPDTLAFLFSLK
jgi:hypothetical protein